VVTPTTVGIPPQRRRGLGGAGVSVAAWAVGQVVVLAVVGEDGDPMDTPRGRLQQSVKEVKDA
jgi:hypothetical protein